MNVSDYANIVMYCHFKNTCMHRTPTSCHCGGEPVYMCVIQYIGIHFTNHSFLYSANNVRSCAHQSKKHMLISFFTNTCDLIVLCTVFSCICSIAKNLLLCQSRWTITVTKYPSVNDPTILWMTPSFYEWLHNSEWPRYSVNDSTILWILLIT